MTNETQTTQTELNQWQMDIMLSMIQNKTDVIISPNQELLSTILKSADTKVIIPGK